MFYIFPTFLYLVTFENEEKYFCHHKMNTDERKMHFIPENNVQSL